MVNATGMIKRSNSFYTNKHRINNTGWMMKWRWWEGAERSANPNILRECWTFLIYIFLHQMRKLCLEFALPNPGEICKHLAGAYNSNSHTRRPLLSYFCMRKQAWKSLQMARTFSIIDPLWRRRNPCSFWSHWHCCQKTTTSFVNVKKEEMGAGRKREIHVHQFIMQSIVHGGGGCVKRDGGGAPLYTVFTRAGRYVGDMTICEIHKPWWNFG